jgi:hypothetical protein
MAPFNIQFTSDSEGAISVIQNEVAYDIAYILRLGSIELVETIFKQKGHILQMYIKFIITNLYAQSEKKYVIFKLPSKLRPVANVVCSYMCSPTLTQIQSLLIDNIAGRVYLYYDANITTATIECSASYLTSTYRTS